MTVIIVVAVLYFARAVLIPLALALLLAFLLAPLVIRLRHWGWGRVPAAASVVCLSFILLGILGTIMVLQLSDLARKLPEYQHNIHEKLESIRSSGGGLVSRAGQILRTVTDELNPPAANAAHTPPGEQRPVPVEIRRPPFAPLEAIQTILGSLLNVVITGAIVIVFTLFMLIEREDLRNRLIRLGGASRVQLTTQVLDDAAHRISRYLLAQLGLNIGFGVLAGIGLELIGVPNPLLWGLTSALLRYIPYLGIWVAAIMPAAVAFAVEPGWMDVPLVFAIFFGIDLLLYNLAEPWLYGTSTGVLPLAILVAAVFWTWLWGAVGLLLATPLTVCAVVVGRHVPTLGFLRVMLSDEPVLPPATRFYQRMLAMDLDEATQVAGEFMKGKSLAELYDTVIIPALSLAEEERHRGKLDDARQHFLFQNTRILVDDIAEHAAELTAGNGSVSRSRAVAKHPERRQPSPAAPDVLCLPARDEADGLAAFMLTQLLAQRGIPARALPHGILAAESLQQVAREQPRLVCVLAVPPFSYMHARYLCRRLRAQFPHLRLVGVILTEHDVDEIKARQPPLVADELASSLRHCVDQVITLLSASNRPAQTVSSSA